MYESYFGMNINPFKKDIDIRNTYEFNDFKEVQNRLKYLLNNKGIRLIYTEQQEKEKHMQLNIL